MTDRAPVARPTMTPEEIAAWERDPGGWVRSGALTCSQDDCNGKVVGVGLCQRHYNRWRRSPEYRRIDGTKPGLCSEDGCEIISLVHGLCEHHYYMSKRPRQIR